MSQKREAQVSVVELRQEYSQDQESTNKRGRGAEGKEQQHQQPGLNVDCKQYMNLPPLPQGDDNPIITQFRPVHGQWELNDENIKRISPESGSTILHNCCVYINTTPVEVYRYLIKVKGCDINAQNHGKNTPLHYAIDSFNPNDGCDITVLHYLLTQTNVDVNIKGRGGYIILHRACQYINKLPLDVFKLLIETAGCDVNAQNTLNYTPLHDAIGCFNPNAGGAITVLHYLLSQKGIDVNIKGYNGDTLLHRACQRINTLPLDVFKVLIETMGCDVNAHDNGNDTPLHGALCSFDPTNADMTVLAYLINQKGVNVNTKGEDGETLLHYVCQKMNYIPIEIFKLLIETAGCDINAQDKYKNTPLHDALRNFYPNDGGDVTILTYLLSQKGIDVNIKNQYGYTILHVACQYINILPLDVFKLLIEAYSADVNAQDGGNDTPLHLAFRCFDPNKADIAVLAYLLTQKGTDVNIKNQYGYTILHVACQYINILPLDVFKLLIETVGCDVNAQDNNNDTPLHLAFRCFDPNEGGDITALIYLINQSNFNVNIKGRDGHTFIHLACIYDHFDLDDYMNSKNDCMGSEDEFSDPDDDWGVVEAKSDTVLSHIVEVIAERCVEWVLDESSS
jgi:ankyrin repeat protein